MAWNNNGTLTMDFAAVTPAVSEELRKFCTNVVPQRPPAMPGPQMTVARLAVAKGH
jgi:hypothetical protein